MARREIQVSAVCGPDADPVGFWHARATSWRALLRPEEWSSVVGAVALTRTTEDGRRDINLRFSGGMFRVPDVDLRWTFPRHDSGSPVMDALQLLLESHFLCDAPTDLLLNAVEPLADAVPSTLSVFPGSEEGRRTVASVLVKMAAAGPDAKDLTALLGGFGANEAVWSAAVELALRTLEPRPGLPMTEAENLFDIATRLEPVDPRLIVARATEALNDTTDPIRLITVMGAAAERMPPAGHPLVLAAWARIVELGYEPQARRAKGWFSNGVALLGAYVDLESVFAVDPGVVRRARWAMEKLGWADRVTWPAGLEDF